MMQRSKSNLVEVSLSPEEMRIRESHDRSSHWKRWGPYLSERSWGTVREDYSAHGTAWDYLSHDQSTSKAYRWGEDGIGASHQTGWTALVAKLIHQSGE